MNMPTETVIDRIDQPGPIFNRAIDENLDGYVEEEFIAAGVANDYAYLDDLETVVAAEANVPWRTRFVVRRPPQPHRSNGTVVIEWLNPTAAWDGTPIWDLTHEEITRSGMTWVGVTIKPVALEFLMGGERNPFGLRPTPEIAARYADLDLFMGRRDDFSGEGLAWDMMNQITAYLRNTEVAEHPLRGFPVDHVMQAGYSQSAGYLITHANEFHQRTTDSYFIAAGGGAHQITFNDPGYEWPDPRAALDEISGVPIVRLQSETEIVAFGRTVNLRPAAPQRWFRWWEVAGGAHAPIEPGEAKGRRDVVGFDGFGDCAKPFPQRPGHEAVQTRFVAHSTLRHLQQWERTAPPPNHVLHVADVPEEGFVELQRDATGNALGGVRLPAVEVPVATYSGTNTGSDFCYLFGAVTRFDDRTLARLYPSHAFYVRKVEAAIQRALAEGFLLSEDAEILRGQAANARAIG